MNQKIKKWIINFLKIGLSAGLIYLVFSQLDWEELSGLIGSANLFYFMAAFLVFVFSHLLSVIRFNIFIRNIGIRMDFLTNTRLYLLGMFYNFFLPGGVGGDAYKVYLLKNAYQKSIKKTGQVIFVERLIGLIAICFLIALFILFIKSPFSYYWNLGLGISGILITLPILKLIIRFMHIYKKRVYIVFALSILIQTAQLLSVWLVLEAFHVQGHYLVYLMFFLISSILSIFSFAGVGIREAVFYYGAQWFQFNSDLSTGVALAFSVFTAVVSFSGMIYLIRPINFHNKRL